MKKNHNISLYVALLILIGLSSCTKNFDPINYGALQPGAYPKTDAEWTSYVMQVYMPYNPKWGYTFFATGAGQEGYTLFQPDNSMFQYNDEASDISQVFSGWGGNFFSLSSLNFPGTELGINRGQGHFEKVKMITRWTSLIDQLNKSFKTSDNVLRKQLKGEAYAARGIMNFYLLYLYGPVPVIMDASKIGTTAEADLTRPDRATFVKYITDDLQTAADSLQAVIPASEFGRFTKGAALTFLMRTYLMEHNYPAALPVGLAIKNLGLYSLNADYNLCFKSSNSSAQTPEEIWSITTNTASEGRAANIFNLNAFSYYCIPWDCKLASGNAGWSQVFGMPWTIVKSFEPGDIRKQWLLTSYVTTQTGHATIDSTSGLTSAIMDKYTDDIVASFEANNIVVCRYADVLLMIAEAEVGSGVTGEGMADLNLVRARAGLAPLSGALTMAKVFNERTHEIWWEAQRRLELIRFNNWNTQIAKYNNYYTSASMKKLTTYPPIMPIPIYAVNEGCAQNIQYAGVSGVTNATYTEALPSYYTGNNK
ncbi:MAG TPA: RagB/SusD family nutrient uptake outer membrane protein [Bacteroidales bacterium]